MKQRTAADSRNVAILRQCSGGTRVVTGVWAGLNGMEFGLIRNDNPLAVYELSGKLWPVAIINLRSGQLK